MFVQEEPGEVATALSALDAMNDLQNLPPSVLLAQLQEMYFFEQGKIYGKDMTIYDLLGFMDLQLLQSRTLE